jgi:short-subunit dehydrogenase
MGLRRILKNFLYRSKYKIKKNQLAPLKELSYLITGANSGIGLALTKEILNQKNKVIATYRKDNKKLLEIKDNNLQILECNQENVDDIEEIKNFIKDKPINIIINAAGIGDWKEQTFENIDYNFFQKMLMINSLSIIKLSEIIIKYSQKNSLKIILNITSTMGSISLNNSGNSFIYRVSKSTLNSVTKNMSVDLKNRFNINVFAVCPGSIKTKMNPEGLVNPEVCSKNILNIVNGFDEKLNGKFIDVSNKEIPW